MTTAFGYCSWATHQGAHIPTSRRRGQSSNTFFFHVTILKFCFTYFSGSASFGCRIGWAIVENDTEHKNMYYLMPTAIAQGSMNNDTFSFSPLST